MATCGTSTEDELSCPICMELFVDPNTPKNLPCGHVCCEVCLGQMVAGDTARSCPECRKPIRIPRGGVSEFPTNFRLRNLAEKHQEVPKPVKKSGVPICPDHEDEKMHYYCTQCNMLACQVCMNLKHTGTGHIIKGVKERIVIQHSEMQSIIVKTKRDIEKAQGTIETLDEIERKVTHSHEKEEKKIDEFVQGHVNELLEQSKILKNELLVTKERKLKHIRETKSQIEGKVVAAMDTEKTVQNAIENCNDSEYVTQHTLLADKMNKLDLTKHTLPPRFTSHAGSRFVPNKLNMNIGSVVSVEPEIPREVKLVQTLYGFGEAFDVAHSATGLLAVSGCNKVIIYEQVRGRYKRKLNLKLDPSNECKPHSVAIHPDGRFMVARQSCIEVYSPDGNYLDKIETAAPGMDTNVFSVRATSDGKVLAGTRGIARSVITEHDARGNIIRTIKTNICPWHMTLIHDRHIAMSNRVAGKVRVMDMETEQETLSIDIAGVEGICYDEQAECLLITRSESASEPDKARPNTGVIEQYSYTTGKLVASLDQGLYRPYGMSLTGDENLVVANDKDVKVYELK